MTWFQNLRIASKLVLAFLVLILLTTFLGLLSLEQIADLRATSDTATPWFTTPSTARYRRSTSPSSTSTIRDLPLQATLTTTIEERSTPPDADTHLQRSYRSQCRPATRASPESVTHLPEPT